MFLNFLDNLIKSEMEVNEKIKEIQNLQPHEINEYVNNLNIQINENRQLTESLNKKINNVVFDSNDKEIIDKIEKLRLIQNEQYELKKNADIIIENIIDLYNCIK